MNTPAMVGECGFSAMEAPNTFLPDRLWQIEPLSSDYDFQWLNYLLNTERYGAAIRATATGTSNSMKNIAKDRLLEIAVPKPPRPEQERIAEALSDMDELIASLEKLIAKKKAIKQGAMQELLTGKRRLPGFTGEWDDTTIDDIAEFHTSTVPTEMISIKRYVGTDNMQSWKFRLMSEINTAMKTSGSREEFETALNRHGYTLVWTDERKYITFICPGGKRCRDKTLHYSSPS